MADPVAQALETAPGTPAGRQAAWYLGRLHGLGDGAGLADQGRFGPTLPDPFRGAATDEAVRDDWRASAERVGAPFEALEIVSTSDFAVEATFTAAKYRRWKLKLAVEDAPPFRITKLAWE